MTTLFGIGVTSFIVALSGALMPGPLLTATIGESSRAGPRAGPLLIAGHAVLELALVGALFLGLAPLLTNITVIAVISCAGGVILFLLAFGMFRSLPTLAIATAPAVTGHGRLVMAGILMSIANPYWSVWWATIGLAYILQSRNLGFSGVAVFFMGHIAADFLWYSFISLTVGRGRKFFTKEIYRTVVGVCAGFLMVFAVLFLRAGIKKMFW